MDDTHKKALLITNWEQLTTEQLTTRRNEALIRWWDTRTDSTKTLSLELETEIRRRNNR